MKRGQDAWEIAQNSQNLRGDLISDMPPGKLCKIQKFVMVKRCAEKRAVSTINGEEQRVVECADDGLWRERVMK